MKKAFTLVEMLIVVAILAVLMSIVFRLGSVGDEDSRRTETVVRLQKLENCLSGYYAAFGSYPPVKVHGSQNIYCAVNDLGDQDKSATGSKNFGDSEFYRQVEAACRAQPFGCEYPPGDAERKAIEDYSMNLQQMVKENETYQKSEFAELYAKSFTGPEASNSSIKKYWDSSDWSVVKLFKFGLMSFLLPRYLFMMGGDKSFFGDGADVCAQWGDNNDMPCDPFVGESFSSLAGKDGGWVKMRKLSGQGDENNSSDNDQSDLAHVANIPTQAVCARWMPNMEGLCATIYDMTFFGIRVTNDDWPVLYIREDSPPNPKIHYYEGNSGAAYKNATITSYDGWGREFYYYSKAPYQSYFLWSSGTNKKTFPPWISMDSVPQNGRANVVEWKKDDIIQMSN